MPHYARMEQAAHYDLHTTEGLTRVQHLRFILPSGEIDTQYNGMTVRGGVLDDGIREMPGSEVIDGRCALQLPRLAAGCHRYDVLVSNNGTDKPLLAGVIHVAPRVTPVDVDDNAPADYLDLVIPEDEGGSITVISESPAWVDDAVKQSLQQRGMYITPVDGVTTLSMSSGSNERDFNFYTFAVNSTYISGHLSAAYKLNKLTLRTPASQNNGTLWRARLYKITDASTMQTAELGESNSPASWVSINSSTAECSWSFNVIPIAASDRLVVEVYAVNASGATISKALISYGVAAAQGSTEGVLIKSEGNFNWRNYTRLSMTLEVAYTDGVSVGDVELATKAHFDSLVEDVVTTGEQVHRDAQTANAAKTAVEGLASTWPQTVSNAEQTISAAKEEAVSAIQGKQADSVLAVGRASQTAQQNITSAQSTAVSTVVTAQTEAVQAVQTARTEAVETITPLVVRAETAKGEIDQAEGRIKTAETSAGTSATNAANSAAAAQQALEAIPQVDAGGNMTLAGGMTAAGTINANGGVRSTAVLSSLEDMMTLGGGYAARVFDLSGYVDLRGMQFATAFNVNKLHHPYLMDKDLVIFGEVPAGNNFLAYPVIKFDRYWVAWGTFPPSSLVLSNGGTYINFDAGEHNAYMGFAFGQSSMAVQRVQDVTPPYIYLKMYSVGRGRTTFTIYYNTGDGEHVIERDGLARSINRLFLIYEQMDATSARISVGVVYGTSNLGVTNRQVTIYQMGVIAVDYYAVVEKVIPFFSNNTTIGSIPTMQRALGLSVHPGMLITDYFSKTN